MIHAKSGFACALRSATNDGESSDDREQMTLRIGRLDGEGLVLDGYGLASSFFLGDPSSIAPDSYDSVAGRGARDRIITADITTINTTMRARSRHKHWETITNRELDWLAAIEPTLDLLATDDEQWRDADGARLSTTALGATIGRGRGPFVATKVLHLKRPNLFPVLDDYVAVMLGINMPDDASAVRSVEIASTLMAHMREQGRANLPALSAVQARLRRQGINRPLVRILDAIVWFSHPASGVAGVSREITVRVP
jgi:Family of unknown function (DUF6308)